MESRMATTANLGLRGTGSGFPQLVRETLSKNAMLPGLTYFYCNSVSQGGNVMKCEKRCRPFGRPLLEKREKWRTPSYFG